MDQQEPNQEKIMQIIKGKRTKRTRPPSSSESTVVTASPTTSSAEVSTEEEEDMANCLILLAQGTGISRSTAKVLRPAAPGDGFGHDVYRCKTCDKSFASFQALGGHRTSHRKAKAHEAGVEDKKTVTFFEADDHDTVLSLQISPASYGSENNINGKSKIHECSICGAEFSSGQALGGHMRRHRAAMPFPSGGSVVQMTEDSNKGKNVLGLDLNLPAPEEAERREPKFMFGSKEKILVFSPSLVDCHY